ncbi:tRNA (adenosine(37)-N6)-threonylcarbamoyltransferase complex dimerization subunit type 1 TsaB [Pusillimonas minor]|uniref:[Ribosomal protein bS18]-alanine N-acetyltransferase n=1 Tax=Pusillimonas minor TaxID=2697024 RepID=A0A842HN63_9BURK|nr:tRNA (adenosine(37)-N6)-threonylcarbamoyltransferase complex dimerization subunit type 1 TsaB [Pusillimonas minor]MBC2768711.1 tRNA (adenosine(37)-N6)-threonylcarbamoyltransferase complex dimerization subunit type 1 TsaB [Pusillimonas minor]
MNLHILALETSSRVCDVALLSVVDGHESTHVVSHDGTGEHAERLLPMVQEALDRAGIARTDLSAIAFGQGPGGFTGLRVACGVAQGLSYALGLPVVPVPSLLAAAAADTHNDAIRVVAQDARMNEIYVAVYVPEPNGDLVELQAATLVGVDDFVFWLGRQARQWQVAWPGPVAIIGDALDAYPGLVLPGVLSLADTERPVRLGLPVRATGAAVAQQARRFLKAGQVVQPAQAAPLYVRDKVAYTTAERQQGMGGNPKTQSEVQLLSMSEAHLDAVAALEARVQSHPWTRGNFADALKAGYSAKVALLGEQVVGFSVVQHAPDVAHLLLIAVSPVMQRQGLGYRLLRQAELETRQAGLPALLLEVRPSNQAAVAFYTNRGFVQVGLRKGYYPNGSHPREDALVLQKGLEPLAGRS